MRIIVNGQQAFGASVLEALVERGEEIVGVYTRPEKPGQRPDPLADTAREHGLPLFRPPSFRREETWEQMKSLRPDLGVMAYVTLFVPEQALDIPTLGTIQYHPSLLPLHRGPSSINWPIIWGKKKTGLSIFWPDDGLDEGPILLQKKVGIGDHTLGSLYFSHLFPMGVSAMLEGVDLVREGKAPEDPAGSCRGHLRGLVQAPTRAGVLESSAAPDVGSGARRGPTPGRMEYVQRLLGQVLRRLAHRRCPFGSSRAGDRHRPGGHSLRGPGRPAAGRQGASRGRQEDGCGRMGGVGRAEKGRVVRIGERT